MTERGLAVTRLAADEFERRLGPLLLEREADNNMVIGIAAELRRPGSPYREGAYLAVVERDSRPLGGAVAAPPFALVLTDLEEDAAELLGDDVVKSGLRVPAVVGTVRAVNACARAWLGGAEPPAPAMRQRLYTLERVVPPVRPAPGGLELGRPEELPLAASWLEQFWIDTGMPMASAATVGRRFLESGDLWWWRDDGRIVSMSVVTGRTPNGARVGYVYTPPERRGHGYASVCVAALSQRLLDSGCRFCCLYTDLANPTSNAIYQRIGYRAAADLVELRVQPPGS